MKNTHKGSDPMKVRAASRIFVALALLFVSTSSHAVTCIDLDQTQTTINQSPESNAANTEAAIPAPTVDALNVLRSAFADYPGVPGGYYGAILSDGNTAFAYREDKSKPPKKNEDNTDNEVAVAVQTLNGVSTLVFVQGHLINSYVGGNPERADAYTVLTSLANKNHSGTVENFMKELNRVIRKTYFSETFYQTKAKNFVATGTDENGVARQYSPAYYYEIIIDTADTMWDQRNTLIPNWQALGFTSQQLQQVPAYYEMSIRFVMEEYSTGSTPAPTGRVFNMPTNVFNQFRADTGIQIPNFSATTGSILQDGFYYRQDNLVIGTKLNLSNQEVQFRLHNVGG